jgi:hypothetical protein
MNSKRLASWFSVVAAIMVMWGVVFAFFGLGILPVDRQVLQSWTSAIYGAIMIGWGTTLFFVGRVALRRNDPGLTKPILAGIALWLTVEALFSARFGVWFNVGVDIGVMVLFGVPLMMSIRSGSKAKEASHPTV